MYTSDNNGTILVCHCAFPSVKSRGDDSVRIKKKKVIINAPTVQDTCINVYVHTHTHIYVRICII
jgi:hypothetical protein